MELLPGILTMILCLALEAFFSGSEIGIISADRMKLRHEAAQGSRGAQLALEMLKKPEWLLSTTLVGTNIAVVSNTTIATALVIDMVGERYSWLAIVIVAPLIWIFGEIVAKSIFQQRADAITPRAIFVLRAASYLFYPLLLVFTGVTKIVARVLGGGKTLNPFTLREEIVTMMEMSAAEGDILPDEKNMIRRVFNFGETTVGDVMMPLIEVAAIECGASCGDARRLAIDTAHKRLPVYDERIDRVTGCLNALELLCEEADQSITPFIRSVRYVPKTKSIEDLLLSFRREGDVIAVVVDEFGGAEGIVSVEDILEEVVGELEDEYDTETPLIRRIGEKEVLVDARIPLPTLADEAAVTLPEGDYESLAGLLLQITGEIPDQGSHLNYQGYEFIIEKADGRRVEKVRIRW
ncbi:hemolysin family protein [Magnetospira sp. QH-2]|uniref:hemolysin family protein n=1 Tax=Magnetospira sp. (strain QH-2) TaxID=1288970 RepID=UPI0003E819C0|nr:hemolysin family protein [Magnetospira sp. QH-2]CCQ73031.1 conserved membrane protein of unknown function [Magnetospira sp. QH-2]